MTQDEDESAAFSDEDFPFGKPPYMLQEMPFNPFKNNSAPISDFFEVLRIACMLPIFFARVAMLLTMFIIGYLSTKVALLGARDVLTKPFAPWRRSMIWPVRLCARGVLFACGYQWIQVKGKAAPRDVAPILVSNHCSFVDPVFIFFAHLPMIVTAKENLDIPIAGAIQKALQVIVVDRNSSTSRRDASGEIKRRAMCNDWSHVALFPEATTTNSRSLVSFKTGAFSCGLPIQPLVVKYPSVRTDPSWVADGPPVHILLFRLMTELHNHMVVEYLPVMEPSLKELRNPHIFAERCRLTMARTLNVNVTEHTYGDVALALEAAKIHVPMAIANVEYGHMEKLFRLDIKEAKQYLRKFARMDVTRSGTVTPEEFVSVLQLPNSASTRRAFRLFDTSERGVFNFREYVAGLAFVTKHEEFKPSMEVVFEALDAKNKNGVLSQTELRDALVKYFPGVSDRQMDRIFKTVDIDRDGSISWADFSTYITANPELLVAILAADPSLLSLRAGKPKLSKENGSA